MMKKPSRLKLANLPTPIILPENLSYSREHATAYIKRDDYTGLEMSGNKVRKLEYALMQGLKEDADIFITCGGIQSNHARATAAAGARLGKKVHLVLKGEEQPQEGNYFLDVLLGAKVTLISEKAYENQRNEIMEALKSQYQEQDCKGYILPEGASNGIGMFGYFQAFEEILEQEKEMGLRFDTICVTDGSSGTYAGLYAANEYYGCRKKIVGFNIYDSHADGKKKVEGIIKEGMALAGCSREVSMEQVRINYEYVGEGYGIASEEVIAFIKKTARETGIILDPVYTGKAMYGMLTEINKGNPWLAGNVLFIHTGGEFGIFPQKERFL